MEDLEGRVCSVCGFNHGVRLSKKEKLFSYLVGESGRQQLDTLMGDTPRDEWQVDNVIEKFDRHCNPNVNETLERYRFSTNIQSSGETIDSYVTELKLLAKTCHLGTLRVSLFRDRIVCGIDNASMKDSLLLFKNGRIVQNLTRFSTPFGRYR